MFDEIKTPQDTQVAPVDIFSDTDKDTHTPPANSQSQSMPQPLPKDTKFDKHLPHSFVTKKTILIAGGVVVVLSIAGVAAQMVIFKKSTKQDTPLIQETQGTQSTNTIPPEAVGTFPGFPVEQAPSNSVAVPPAPQDSDADGLSDDEEKGLGTDVTLVDSDGDGLSDYEEVKQYHTDSLKADTDADGFTDMQEIQNGYNPLGAGKLEASVEVPQPVAQ